MSAYYPPAENVPIFDASLFRTTNSQLLTRAVASSSFLTFPIAQGTETLKDIIVEGTSSFTNTATLNDIIVGGTASFTNTALPTSTAPLPAFNDSSTKMPTTQWVQGAIALNGANLTYVNQTFPVVSVPATAGNFQTTWSQQFTLSSAGTWLINGNFNVSFLSGMGTTSTAGFYVNIFEIPPVGPIPSPITITYNDFSNGQSISNPFKFGYSITKDFSISQVITITQPMVFGAGYGLSISTYGTEFSGSATAVKLSSV